MAENSGLNSGPGFCILAGHHFDFSKQKLCDDYGSHGGYVSAVAFAAFQAHRAGFLLRDDAVGDIQDAAKLRFSCKDDEAKEGGE